MVEYERIRLLKESEKGTVELVREEGGTRIFVRKRLKGNAAVYRKLRELEHPGLAKIYTVDEEDGFTVVLEEYIEGQTLGNAALSEKELVAAIRELCSVLDYLHSHGIVHRDVKPSNIILAKDGHIRLIDFDAARLMKEEADRDTVLLGTRGYAPPEQYGFAQTDERADIYALGITMKQLLEEKADKLAYRRIIARCTNPNPQKRYRRASAVKRALSAERRYGLAAAGIAAVAVVCFAAAGLLTPDARETAANADLTEQNIAVADGATAAQGEAGDAASKAQDGAEVVELTALAAPEAPHWDGESGIGVWGNVPESGADGEVSYRYRIYRTDTPEAPDPETDQWVLESGMRGNGGINQENKTYSVNMAEHLSVDGYYYFAVCAAGDGVRYADSPYAMSDAFSYTGEDAPPLPAPEGLAWKMVETETRRYYFATWSNLDDYADSDSFNVTVYDKDGNYVMNNIWTKAAVAGAGENGITVNGEFLTEPDGAYRFTVQALTSRPNEYKSSPMPEPVPEEYYSPWYYSGN